MRTICISEPISAGCYQPWHPFWHTMHAVFIFYSTALFSLVLVLSNKQTNKQVQGDGPKAQIAGPL
jgi:hypothetical protein